MHRRLPLVLLAVAVLVVVAWRGWPPGGKGSRTNSVPSRASEGARNIRQAEALLRKRLEAHPADTVGAHIDAMLGFYREEHFAVEEAGGGGDGLLVQWGTYDWGQGSHFELDMTRQFFVASEDEPFQLSMTMRFKPTAALSAWGRPTAGASLFEHSVSSRRSFGPQLPMRCWPCWSRTRLRFGSSRSSSPYS